MAQNNVGVPMERMVVDVLGPLPESEHGNKYLLIIADYFTKWTETFPIPEQEATTVAEIIVREVVSRFGVPLSLHSEILSPPSLQKCVDYLEFTKLGPRLCIPSLTG